MSKLDKEAPEAPIFFLDECLGGEKVAEVLTRAGLIVELHKRHFTPGTPDKDWLPVIGERGWVLLTQDKAIKRRPLEILVLRQYRVSAFVVSAKGLRGEEIGALIEASIPKILRILKKTLPPLVASISRGSVVELQEGTPKYPRKK